MPARICHDPLVFNLRLTRHFEVSSVLLRMHFESYPLVPILNECVNAERM